MNDDLHALNQSQQSKRAALAAWRASRKTQITLPSGLTVEVRDATIMDLMVDGNIPQTLMDMIISAAEKNNGEVDLKTFSGLEDFGKLLSEMVKIVLVDPPVADVADEDHIALDELSGSDKMAIFNWANREVGSASPFRAQPVEPVATGPDGASV